VLFLTALLVFTEINTGLASQTSVMLFKYGSKAGVVPRPSPSDEEKISPPSPHDHDADAKAKAKAAARVLARRSIAAQPQMTDVFSWQHLRYTVPLGHGEERLLLDDVSGYVAPGRLTALMGESGAGKVGSIFLMRAICDLIESNFGM
jgi:ATP-binding cassette, subfamily G (WHITE), member 2, SNQ2